MHTALNRLRLGFVLLGALLLSPLFFVLRAAEDRLEEQRKLRHEIVAERIFDEMERELSTLLANEAGRSSDAYDAKDTQVDSWSPFVVGYFTSDGERTRVVAAEQLTAPRSARVSQAVAALWRSSDRPQLGDQRAERNDAQPARLEPSPAASAKQDEVLRQLNRARKLEPSKHKASSRERLEDPLMGL
ncbi:MAG TPA: hypothetical protein VJU61_04545 [Polyangiaceae bacterium]|nr:hypothetical protein [Polyangiaceae bacterium]